MIVKNSDSDEEPGGESGPITAPGSWDVYLAKRKNR